jgi:hypothetical protein
MFAVDDVDDVVARLRTHGAELLDEIVRYEDLYRLCFLRGPEGIIIGLSERLGGADGNAADEEGRSRGDEGASCPPT